MKGVKCMKKVVSGLLAMVILLITLMPMSAFAKDKNGDKGMYKVNTKVYADAYMLINLDDENFPVIAQKNKDKKKYPASLTKIATAMVTINNVKDLSQKATYSQKAYDALLGSGAQVAGMKVGEKYTVEELLYLTLVHSACDACQALAEFVGGDTATFVKMMNDWAASVGCKKTHFVNPDGLHDDDHYSCVSDMALMTLAALENDTFTKIATTPSYKFGETTFIHTNFMLDKAHITYYYEYASGIKTGSTSQAGFCVITKASKNGYNYLAIVMDSPIKKLDGIDTKCSFIDAKTLFDWAFDSLKYSMVIRQNDVISEVPVEDGKDADTVQLVAEKDVNTLVPVSLDPSAVLIKPVDLPEKLEAPLAKGDKVCTADIIYGDKVIGSVDLVCAKTVELSTFLKVVSGIKDILSSKAVKVLLVVIIIACIAYVLLFINRLRKAKIRAQEKRRRREEMDYGNRDYRSSSRGQLDPPKRRK